MIDGLLPYAKYKDSGLPWLPKIPASWSVIRNGRLFTQRNQTGHSDLPILEVSLRSGVRVRDMKDGGRKQVMSDRSKYKQARVGDLAYNTMRMWQGAVGVAPVDGLVSPAYVVATPVPEVDASYLARLFRTSEYLREIDTFSRGIVKDRNRLYWEAFKQIPTPLPPHEEQRGITRFLAHTQRRVGLLLATKARSLRFLAEVRLAIVSDGLTRSSATKSRSARPALPWLGRIPDHWAVGPLRARYRVELGKMLDTKRITGAHLLPYPRNTDVQWDRINLTGLPLMDVAPIERERYTVKSGDLLVCEGGEVGRAAIWDGPTSAVGFQKALHRLRPRRPDEEVSRFLYYQLLVASKRGVFLADGNENTIAHLTCEKLRRHRFAFPPRPEQAAIVEALDRALRDVDRATEQIKREIALVHEFHARVEMSVVTGALDVRGATIPLDAVLDTDVSPATYDAQATDEQAEEESDLNGKAERVAS